MASRRRRASVNVKNIFRQLHITTLAQVMRGYVGFPVDTYKVVKLAYTAAGWSGDVLPTRPAPITILRFYGEGGERLSIRIERSGQFTVWTNIQDEEALAKYLARFFELFIKPARIPED